MDPVNEITRLLVQQGGFAVIAVLIFLAYRKDVKGTAEVVIDVLQKNTATNVELITLVREVYDFLKDSHRSAVR